MASLVESWAHNINGDEISDGSEISKFDSDLLMSLLEESNGEEYDDEQLNRMMQSLEAEINEQNMVECHDLTMEPELFSDEEGGQNCLKSMDFGWADTMDSSPSDDMNWPNYMDQYELDLDHLVEIEGVRDYSQINFNVVVDEEHGFISSLWHENTYNNRLLVN